MLAIALDESGSFEGDSVVKIIGGLIFNNPECDDFKAYEEEEKRVEEFLKEQCKIIGIKYPYGIHAIDMRKKADKDKLNKLKYAVKTYLKDSGKYHMTVMIKSREDVRDVSSSNMVSIKHASNLYEIMAWSYISNILFYNDVFDSEKNIVFDLATRVVILGMNEHDKINMYKELGYKWFVDKKENNVIFLLTSQQSFKAAISSKMVVEKIDKDINFELKVRPINYKKEEEPTTPILYLADLVCDIIRDYINTQRVDYNIKNLIAEGEKITGNKMLAWFFDDVNEIWQKLYQANLNKDYIEQQYYLFQLENSKSKLLRFYKENWVNRVEDNIEASFNINNINLYINELQKLLSKEIMYSKSREENIKFGVYLGKKLWNHFEVNKNIIPVNLRYKLCDLLVTANNQIDDIEGAKCYFVLCNEMRTKVNRDDYFGTCLNYAQILIKDFKYDEAITKMLVCEDHVEQLRDVITGDDFWGIFETDISENSNKYALLGKVYSTLGQLYSFKCDYEEGEKYFLKALNEFEDGSRDVYQTHCYILHMYIAANNYDKFMKYSGNVFNKYDFKLSNVIDTENVFDLWIFLRYINRFNVELSHEEIDSLKEFILKLSNDEKMLPWQLVYMELGRVFYKHDLEKEYKTSYELVKSCRRNKENEVIFLYIELKMLLLKHDYSSPIIRGVWSLLEDKLKESRIDININSDLDFKDKVREFFDKVTYFYV